MSMTLNENGFTLVELLVALTIMTIGIMATIQMQVVAIQSNAIANRQSVATSLAQEVMDDIQAWDANAPPVIGVFSPPAPGFSTTAAYNRLGANMNAASTTFTDSGTYTATYTITLVQPDLTTAFISVTVAGGGRTVTLTSLKRIA